MQRQANIKHRLIVNELSRVSLIALFIPKPTLNRGFYYEITFSEEAYRVCCGFPRNYFSIVKACATLISDFLSHSSVYNKINHFWDDDNN